LIQPDSKIRVMLVDNEATQLELIEISLGRTEKSFIFKTAKSATEALELMRAHSQSFDCIISDYVMPIMNGVELCEKLRAEGCCLPFILFTLRDDIKMIERAFESGVDSYLEKLPSLDIYSVLAQSVKNLGSTYRASHALRNIVEV
jgi:CheY-like chemotaxis protein